MVVDEFGAAVYLDCRVRTFYDRLGRVELRDRRLDGVGLAGVLQDPRAADEHPGRVALDDHVRDQLLDELEAGDRDPELLALGGVAHRRIDASVADADAAGGDAVATRVERRHRDLEAIADLAEEGLLADL